MSGQPATPKRQQQQRQRETSGSSTPHRELQPFMDSMPSPGGPSSLADDDGGDENVFRDWTFEEVLDDLGTRFLVNLPAEEMTLVRAYWQAEQAHWFYEDYVRPLNPLLPSLSQRQFTHLIIESSPFYAHLKGTIDYDAVWAEYCAYKKMVPCCGGILINATGDKCLMVRGWKSNAGWCFPRGKINSEESDVACAIREVEEETGFDMSALVHPDDFIKTQVSTQDITMFIAKGIDEATVFETQTRKEIGAIEWVPLVDLPTWTYKKGPKRTGGKGQKRFYNVTPFVGPLKKWMQKNGINPNPPRKRGKEGGKSAAPRERDLQPYTFDDSPRQRELEPYSFGNLQHSTARHAPSTTIDDLFASFVQKDQKADNVSALQSNTARTLDKMFRGLEVSPKSAEQQEHDHQDDMLAQLLGNIGTVSAKPPAPPANEKQSKLLSVLNAPPAAPVNPPQSLHQTNLLSMLAPPSSAPAAPQHSASQFSSAQGDERAQRHRALLESTLGGLAPPTPVKGGHGILSPGQMVSPIPQLPPAQPQGWHGAYPQEHSSPLSHPQQQQHGSPRHMAQQQQQYNSSRHIGNQQHFPQSPQTSYQSQPPPQPPVNDHQRNLLGTLFAAKGPQPPAGGHLPGPPVPQVHPGPPHGMHPDYPPYSSQPPFPSQGYPQHVRPPAGLAGLANQPGGNVPFPSASGQNGPPPVGWQLGPGPRPGPYGPSQGFGGPPPPPPGHYGPPPGAFQQPPPPNQLPQPQQPQQPQLAQQPPQPMAAPQAPHPAQSPPMHQPVARPPVGGPLLSLAAGH